MKLLKSSFHLFSILCLCFLNSCEKEDVVTDEKLLKILLSNQWVGSQDEFNEYESGNVEYREDKYRFLFFEDGWGYCVWLDKSIDLNGKDRNEDAFSFTYQISGNTVNVSTEYSRDYADFQYINGSLIDESSDMLLKPSSMTEAQKEADMEKWFPTKGACGEKTNWKYDRKTKTMTISGNGSVKSYEHETRPWENYEIETLIYEEGVINTGPYAFYKKNIPNITLSNTIEQISRFSFYFNGALEKIDIPLSCYGIYEEAFHGCHKLGTMTFNGSSSIKDSKLKYLAYRSLFDIDVVFEKLELPNTMRYIEDDVFFSSGIKYLTLNEGLISLGNYTFSNNSIENDIIIPESMKEVSGGFEGSFNKIIIKGDFTDIKSFTFQTSSTTGDFYIYKNHKGDSEPSLFLRGTDNNDIIQNWTLHVPTGTKKYYENAYYFEKFGKIIEENY